MLLLAAIGCAAPQEKASRAPASTGPTPNAEPAATIPSAPEAADETIATPAPAAQAPAQSALPILNDDMAGADSKAVVGQLAVSLNGRWVSPDHAFKSGDRIQFVVSSNQAGWFFLYHGVGPERRLLWPETDGGGENFFRAHQTVVIPPQGAIRFDEQAQDEAFNLIIVSNAAAPTTGAPAATSANRSAATSANRPAATSTPRQHPVPRAEPPTPAKDSANEIVQIAIKGGVEVNVKGVTMEHFQGGPQTAFKAAPGNDASSASIVFLLKHVDGEQ